MRKLGTSLVGAIVLCTTGLLVFAQTPQTGTPPPVPVATPKFVEKTPKKDEKKDDSTPKETKKEVEKKDDDKEQGGFIPPRFVKNVLDAMPANSSGYIPVTALRVDSERRCWLRGDQAYTNKTESFVVLVNKDESGQLHVVLDSVTHQWVAGEFDKDGWLSVKSVRDVSPTKSRGE